MRKLVVCKIHINEKILIKNILFSTNNFEIKNICNYEPAKNAPKICNQMLQKEITKEHQSISISLYDKSIIRY